jgi:hypothetical protein
MYMKVYRSLVTIFFLIALIAIPQSQAFAGGPTGSWRSGIACQNTDPTNAASVTLSFYNENNSTVAASYPTSGQWTIPAGSSRNWLTTSSSQLPSFPTNFTGSAVISSDREITCNVNTELNGASGTTASPYRGGTSYGFSSSQTAPVLFVPQVMREYYGYNSYIALQNTGSNDVTVDIQYYNASTGLEVTAAKESLLIPASASRMIYQNDKTILGSFIGAAKITSQDNVTPLAAVVNIYNNLADYTKAQLQSYNAMTSGARELLVPRFVRKFYGYNSGITVQNIHPTISTTVTITFTFNNTPYVYTSPSIAPNTSLVLFAPNITQLVGVDSLSSDLRSGNATIFANDPNGLIIAIVNEDNRGVDTSAWRNGQGSTYNAIPRSKATNTVFLAQMPRRVIGVFSGGIQIANTTSTATTCSIEYAGVPSATETNVALPANGSLLRFAPNVPNLPDGFNAAVKVSCGQPIVGISNFQAVSRYGDSFVQTNGLNQ